MSTSTCCSGESPDAGSVRRSDPAGPRTTSRILSCATSLVSKRIVERRTSLRVTCADEPPLSLASTAAILLRTHALDTSVPG
eukprot:scaffold156539_cov26-Tisochrysis_lutea.AAC.1